MREEIVIEEFVSCFLDTERKREREMQRENRAATRRIDGETRSVTQNDPRGPEETRAETQNVYPRSQRRPGRDGQPTGRVHTKAVSNSNSF